MNKWLKFISKELNPFFSLLLLLSNHLFSVSVCNFGIIFLTRKLFYKHLEKNNKNTLISKHVIN